jgi:4-diphosphocytidyl-2-C-methyl-D-erythritol kinase
VSGKDSEFAPAKINLALHVLGRMDNGYHALDTLFAFVDVGDMVRVEADKHLSMSIDGPFSAGLETKDNLVLRAAEALASASGNPKGARLNLTKNLPVASGLGGGSADAAATLRLLNRYWGTGLSEAELEALAAPLGADIAACVRSQLTRGTGVGDVLQPMESDSLQGLPVLLINPLFGVSTPMVFGQWDRQNRGELQGDDPMAMAVSGRNDLEIPAIALCPQIGDILALRFDPAPEIFRMSGSGATCFALFNDVLAAEAAYRCAKKEFPEYWTVLGQLL